MRKRHLAIIASAFVLVAAMTVIAVPAVWGRAGGGGSESSSDGGSDYGSSGSSYDRDRDGGSSRPATLAELIGSLVIMGIILVVMFRLSIAQAKKAAAARKEFEAMLAASAAKDPAWQPADIERRAGEVFHAFQKAWGEFDLETMRGILTMEYFKRMVLELEVLKNLGRRNRMEDVAVIAMSIASAHDDEDDAKDRVTVMIFAKARDVIMHERAGKPLHVSTSSFREYWHFAREDGQWKLNLITQGTESARMIEGPIAEFSKRNGFYYDPDFGWLMIPDKGALFGLNKFGTSDVNNHVVGYYRNKVVEFYTYVPDKETQDPANYVIAQAILPTSYNDILIRKKVGGLWGPSKPRGLRQMSLEYGDFNEKFEVFAHPDDQINTLELLTPNFMLKIYDLPFTLNVEIVGNVLYLYTVQRDVSYEKMLEILSWAFDEMKM